MCKKYLEDFKFLFSLGNVEEFSCDNFQGTKTLKTNINSPALNLAASTQNTISIPVEEIKKYFGNIPFIWWADSNQTEVINTLKKNSFNKITKVTGMSIQLSDLVKLPISQEISIKEVSKLEDLTKWIEICAVVNNLPIEITTQFIKPIFTEISSAKFYLGYYNNVPVGINTVLVLENEVLVCNLTVLPEYRKKGCGYALTYVPLQKMYTEGKTHATLHASDIAIMLYEKIGFKKNALIEGFIINTPQEIAQNTDSLTGQALRSYITK